MTRSTLALVALLSCAATQRPVQADVDEPVEATATTAEVTHTEAPALEELRTIPDVAERAVRSVVNVSARRTVKAPAHPFGDDPILERFFGIPPSQLQPRKRIQEGEGSGVVIDAEQGIVVTNNHVVQDAEEVEVSLSDGERLRAEVVGTDAKSDLAVLRLEDRPDDLQALPVGDSDGLRLGEMVLAIGNPFGVGQTVTMGIVSAKGRAHMGIVDYEDFIQTDAAINPGNSGGALVDLEGRLVGINTAILSRNGGSQGVGFAIPTAMMEPIVASILDDGTVQRGYLGVMIQELRPELAEALDLEVEEGIVVSDVVEDGPAARAGFRRGDVIVGYDGESVHSTARFRSQVAASGPGADFEIEVVRGGRRKKLKGTLDLLPGDEPAAEQPADDQEVLAGIELGLLTAEKRAALGVPKRLDGVVVKRVTPGSAAERAGVRPGDVITEVNREPVQSVDDVGRIRANGDHTLLLLYRDGGTRFVVLSR